VGGGSGPLDAADEVEGGPCDAGDEHELVVDPNAELRLSGEESGVGYVDDGRDRGDTSSGGDRRLSGV